MISRLLTYVLCLAVTAVLTAEAAVMLLRPPERLQDWLQVLVARQLADTLQREVRVGRVQARWLTHAVVRDVAVAAEHRLADGVMLRVRRLELDYDLIAIVRREVPAPVALDRVVLDGAWARVERGADRVINFARLLPRRPPLPPEKSFQGVIEIRDSEISYVDYAALGKDGSPLTLDLAGVSGRVDMRRLGWIQVQAEAGERLGRVHALRASVEGQPSSGVWWITGDLSGVNLRWWYDFVLAMPGIDLEHGEGDLSGTLALGPRPRGHRGVGLNGEARVRGAVLRFAALNDRPIKCDLEGSFSLAGLQVDRLDAWSEGAHVQARGALVDFARPCLDVSFAMEAPHPAQLARLAPESVRLPQGVETEGPLVVKGTLVGPVLDANLEAEVTAPGGVRLRAGDLSAQGRNLCARISLLDLTRPSVRAGTQLADVRLGDLPSSEASPKLSWGGGELNLPRLPGPVSFAPIDELRAEVLWTEGTAAGQTRLYVPRVTAGDLEVSELRAEGAVVGPTVSVRQAQCRVLSADVSARGVMDLAGKDGVWAYGAGDIVGLDLGEASALLERLGVEEAAGAEIGGTAAAQFAGTWTGNQGEVTLSASVAQPRYAGHALDDLRLLAEVNSHAVRVKAARFARGAAVGWAEGTAPWQGGVVGRFALGAANLTELLPEFDVKDVKGEVWAKGTLSGGLKDPRFEVDAQVFAPTWRQWRGDALLLRAHGGLNEVHVDDLYASVGRVAASADGVITPQFAEAPSIENVEDLLTLVRSLPDVDGTIDGRLRVAGPIDPDTRQLAQIQDLDLEGAVRFEARLGGTLHRPALDGQLFTRYGRWEAVATDAAIMNVRLAGDVLDFDQVMMQMGEAVLQGEGRITSLYDEPMISARLSANDVVLQDLELWRNLGLPLSGRVSLPYLSLEGPLNDPRGMAQIEAEDLMLGDEQIGAVTAWVVFDDQSLILPRTTLAVAGGELSLEGQYRLGSHELLPSRVELVHVSIPRLLAAARPVAATFAAAPAQGMSLADRLGSLSMRVGGIADGSLSLAGLLPEGAAPEADPADRPTLKQILQQIDVGIDLQVRETSYDHRKLPDMKVDVRVTDEGTVSLAAEATEGDALVTADGTWDPDGYLDLLAEVYALDIATLHQWMPKAVRSMGGRLNLSVQATGRDVAPKIIGSLDVVAPEVEGVRLDLVSAPIIRIANGYLDIDSLVLRAREQEVFVDGHLPFDWAASDASHLIPHDRPLSVVVRSEKTDLSIFPPLFAGLLEERGQTALARLTAAGILDSRIEVSGTIEKPQLSGRMTLQDGRIAVASAGMPVEDIALQATFSPEPGGTRLELGQASARVGQIKLQGTGEAQLAYLTVPELHRNSYDFVATIAAPRQDFAGGLRVQDVVGTVSLRTDEQGRQIVTVDGVGARVGDGRVTLGGEMELLSFVPAEMVRNRYDLTLSVDHARPRYSNLFVGTLDGTVRATTPGPGEPVRIAGSVTVSRAEVGMPPAPQQPVVELTGMPEWFPAPVLALNLGVGEDVVFKTAGISAPLQPNPVAVTVTGTPQRPVITGTIEAQEGRASVPAGALDVGAAGVQFAVRPALGTGQVRPPVPLEVTGRVWGTATKRIAGVSVGGRDIGTLDVLLEVSGSLPNQIQVRASSMPPLSEEQIYALLGAQQLGGVGADGGEALSDVMSRQFMDALGAAFRHYIFQPFAEDLKKMLGLSMFEISFAYDHPVQIKVGKYLIENLLVTYQASMLGVDNEWEAAVSYQVSDRYKVSFQTNHLNNSRLFVEYVRSF